MAKKNGRMETYVGTGGGGRLLFLLEQLDRASPVCGCDGGKDFCSPVRLMVDSSVLIRNEAREIDSVPCTGLPQQARHM